MLDTRYKAVRTENTHLKGMMGDLDPGRYMVMCWRRSVAWTEGFLLGQILFTERLPPVRRAGVGLTKYLVLGWNLLLSAGWTIWISDFLLVLFLNWAQFKLFPQIYITVLAFRLDPYTLHGPTPVSSARCPAPETPVRTGSSSRTWADLSHSLSLPPRWGTRTEWCLINVSPVPPSVRGTVFSECWLDKKKNGSVNDWGLTLWFLTGAFTGLHKTTYTGCVPFFSVV